MKLIIMLFNIFCVLFLSACAWSPKEAKGTWALEPSETDNRWVVDGMYRAFNVPRKTMEKLMELVAAEDINSICGAFSNTAKENANNFDTNIQALVRFLRENAVSWDFTGAYSIGDRHYGIRTETRSATYRVQTNGGDYTCCIRDVPNNSEDKNVVGLSSIFIYPMGLDIEYGHGGQSGSLVVYLVGRDTEDFLNTPSPMEKLVELIEQGDTNGILKAFSPVVRDTTDGPQEKISELISFIGEQVISWEPYTWMQSEQYINGVKVDLREMFFHLQTDSGLYRCDIRDIPESINQEVSTGILSISIFPALFPNQTPDLHEDYERYCTWGQENRGIYIAYRQNEQ